MPRTKETNESESPNRVGMLLTVPMFTAGEVVRFCNIKAETLQTWLARRLINVMSLGDRGPGRGRLRLFNLPQLIQVAIMDDLVSRFGVTPAIASQISATISLIAQVKLISSSLGLPESSYLTSPTLKGFWVWTGTDAEGNAVSRFVETEQEMSALLAAPTQDIGVVIRLASVHELIVKPALDTMAHKVMTDTIPPKAWAMLMALESKHNPEGN